MVIYFFSTFKTSILLARFRYTGWKNISTKSSIMQTFVNGVTCFHLMFEKREKYEEFVFKYINIIKFKTQTQTRVLYKYVHMCQLIIRFNNYI